ncbi:opioid growth factor receptor-related protein [Methylocaldum sp. 14B]|jgi:hypothetical protein|uniref:opioid growth factor receptor-related protein n=1 Tax=unclassified Methylocaldum TaxID=2622260 RepID=UPI00098B3343|nr:opioid growth factor receptor-related protein [Methylocaldum sp. 14B]
MNHLILFYIGSHPDSRGRLLAEILEQDDYWLEVTHDYIQWLFPNKEKSRVTPGAPTITKEIQEEFLNDEILQQHLKASFNRMLAFYGLVDTGSGIKKSENWERKKSNWFVKDTHNNLRITRILKSLRSLGLETEAIKFHEALVELAETEKDCGIGEAAQRFWAEAVKNA